MPRFIRTFAPSFALACTLILAAGCGGNAPPPEAPAAAQGATTASANGASAKGDHHDEGHAHGEPHGDAAPSGKPVKAPGEAKVGDTTRCPVSGEEFDVSETTPHVEHQGKTFYTCCAGCQKKLAKDPGKYLGAGATPASATPAK